MSGGGGSVAPVIELVWRTGLDETEAREVQDLAAAATETDATAPLGEHVLLHLDPSEGEAVQLLARDAGALAGFAHLDLAGDGPGSAELVVHPEHRGAGLGTRMVEQLLEKVAPSGLQMWAHGDLPAAGRIAEKLGFARSRVLWQMRRSLEERSADVSLPPGVRIRPFVVGADEPEFLRVNNAAFDWHPEQGGWGHDDVAVRESAPWFDPAGFLLAVDESDRLLGYHWTKVHEAEGPDERIGEVYVLGVDPAAQGMHLGTALTLAGLHHLRDRGLNAVLLYVEADNAAAVQVYRKLGFALWHSDVQFTR